MRELNCTLFTAVGQLDEIFTVALASLVRFKSHSLVGVGVVVALAALIGEIFMYININS